MDALPPELLARVVYLLLIEQERLAPYATISQAWQHAVEKHTFAHLKVSSNELKTLEAAITKPHAYRCTLIRRVLFSIKLPDYDDKACGRFEREADKRLNNEAFSQAIAGLFAVLAAFGIAGNSSPIDLLLHEIHSSMDVDQRNKEKLRAEGLASTLGRRNDLFELRYEDSYLQLLQPEKLPLLNNVVSLTVKGDAARKLAPTVAAALAAKLPNLGSTEWLLSDMERKRPDRRTQLRLDFAKQLQLISVPNLEIFNLTLRHTEPANENFGNADVRGHVYLPGDTLSSALRGFTQARNLTSISMDGPICVGPELFWPETENCKKPQWHALREVDVRVSQVRPDGGWYIDLDPDRLNEDEAEEEEEEEEEEEDDDDSNQELNGIGDTSSGYDSSESFFAMDELPPDEYGYPEEKRDQRLNGSVPVHRFRTQPNVELEKLFVAAARAAAHMPKLRRMGVGLEIEPSGRSGRGFQAIGLTFLVAGAQHPIDVGPGDKEYARLYWHGPRGWRMSEELQERWRVLLKQDGIVRYKEW